MAYKQTYKVVFLDNLRTEVCFWMVEASCESEAVSEIQAVVLDTVKRSLSDFDNSKQRTCTQYIEYIQDPANFMVYSYL